MKTGPLGNVPQVLRLLRHRAQLTQAQAARKVGIAPRSLASYELGNVSPTVDVYARLLAAYSVETIEGVVAVARGEIGTPEATSHFLEASPGQSAAFYREMARVLERVEALERELQASKTTPPPKHR